MDICHSPESGTPGAPLRPKSSAPRSGFVQQVGAGNSRRALLLRGFQVLGRHGFIPFSSSGVCA